MAIIYSYPPETNPQPTDLLVGTSTVTVDGTQTNVTRSYSMQTLTDYIKQLGGIGVESITFTAPLTGPLSYQSKFGLKVSEYSPNLVKKSLVGSGHASKEQVQMMIKTLLPGCDFRSADSADALAIAICHAHHRRSENFDRQLELSK